MKKTLKRTGAVGLAAATIVSGLSFGSTVAFAAPTSPSTSTPSATTATTVATITSAVREHNGNITITGTATPGTELRTTNNPSLGWWAPESGKYVVPASSSFTLTTKRLVNGQAVVRAFGGGGEAESNRVTPVNAAPSITRASLLPDGTVTITGSATPGTELRTTNNPSLGWWAPESGQYVVPASSSFTLTTKRLVNGQAVVRAFGGGGEAESNRVTPADVFGTSTYNEADDTVTLRIQGGERNANVYITDASGNNGNGGSAKTDGGGNATIKLSAGAGAGQNVRVKFSDRGAWQTVSTGRPAAISNAKVTINKDGDKLISGTATAGATVHVGSTNRVGDTRQIITAGSDGSFSAVLNTGAAAPGTGHVYVAPNGVRSTVDIANPIAGTIVDVPQAAVALTRGGTAPVPIVVQNDEHRTNTSGTAVFTAPDGTTFPAQATAEGSWRRGTSGSWIDNNSLDLTNGRITDDGRTITFDIPSRATRPENEQFRYQVNVATPATAGAITSEMDYVYSGTSSAGDFRAGGSTPVTLEKATVDLDAKIAQVNNISKTVVVTGTATPNANIAANDVRRDVGDDGKFAVTVPFPQAGPFTIIVQQIVGGQSIGAKILTGTIVDGGTVVPSPNDGVTLDRDAATPVEVGVTTTAEWTRQEGTMVLTAPEGTTFKEGQTKIDGQLKHPGGAWSDDTNAHALHDGQLSADKRTYTYAYRGTVNNYGMQTGSQMRWTPELVVDDGAPASTGDVRFVFAGTGSAGDYRAAGSTPTTIGDATPPAPIIESPTVETPEAGSTVTTSRPTFTGHGEEGAVITIGYGPNSIIGTAVVKDGLWEINPSRGLALGTNNLIVTQTAGTDVQTLTHTINRVMAEQPLRVTSHVDGQLYAQGMTTFRGVAPIGSVVTAVNQWGTPMGTAAATDGTWAFNRNLGPTAAGYDLTFTATPPTGAPQVIKLKLNYGGVFAFQVTSPAHNSTYTEGTATFTGTATPNTTVRATNQWGTPMGTADSGLTGTWAFDRYLGPTSAGYDITFVATRGEDSQRSIVHLNYQATNVPVAVTSIADGATYRPGLNVLEGTGTPGATVSAVNATNGWNVPMGQAKVDGNGNWQLPERNWGPSNDYAIKVTQTNPDKTTSETTVTVLAPRFAPLTITSHASGDSYDNGAVVRFAGTATPLAAVTVRSATSDAVYRTVEADVDGNWSFTRAWGPSHDYTLIFEQKALDGQTGDPITGFVWKHSGN